MNLDPLIRRVRSTLAKPVEADPYLMALAGRIDSHRFLGGCAQAVFIRQVDFLVELLQAKLGRERESIPVLDWGCGKGHTRYLLRKKGLDVSACDVAHQTKDSAFGQEAPILRDAGIQVVPLTDPVKLPFEERHFDCVTSFGVLEHVQNDEGSMREIHRILKTGGIFFLTFLPYFLSWRASPSTDARKLISRSSVPAEGNRTACCSVGFRSRCNVVRATFSEEGNSISLGHEA